jgi:hypothetical protein
MAFKTFVQVGRAVIVTKGPESGKLGVIGIYLTSLNSSEHPLIIQSSRNCQRKIGIAP